MALYLKLLKDNFTFDFYFTIFIDLLSSFIVSYAVSDFIGNSGGLPAIFIIGVLQFVFAVQYFLFRVFWRGQILKVKDDSFALYAVGNNLSTLVRYKIFAFLSFVLLHMIMSAVIFLFICNNAWNIFFAAESLGAFLSVFIFLFDFLGVNERAKVVREIMLTAVVLVLAALFWYPSIPIFAVTLAVFFITSVISAFLIRREYFVKNK